MFSEGTLEHAGWHWLETWERVTGHRLATGRRRVTGTGHSDSPFGEESVHGHGDGRAPYDEEAADAARHA